MATSKQSTLFCTVSLLLMLFVSPSFPSFVTLPSRPSTSPDVICNSTQYPSFCKSILPHDKNGTIQYYTWISLNQSLLSAQNLLSLVEYHMTLPLTSSLTTIRAIEDCHFLASSTIDILADTLQTINYEDSLDSLQAEDYLTWISAAVTNQQTCADGLEEASPSDEAIKNDLMPHISNGTKFLSVSLALFKLGWIDGDDDGRMEGSWLRERILIRDKQLFEFIRGEKQVQDDGFGGNDVNVSELVLVNPNGGGDFTTINAAVDAAPNSTAGGNQYFVIYVVKGLYEEYVSIPSNKQNLMMIGDGINQTVITGNHSYADNYTTFDSATFAVVASGFVAVNITFRNTAGAINYQAVALRSGADLSAFYNCSFEGYQDTLYTHSLRQFYRECDIYGTVDFIFGNAAVVLQDCNIYPRLPLDGQFNAITAQGRTDLNQNTGTSIQNCTITAAEDLGTTKTYLGRPWKEYCRTVFMQSFMDSLIDPSGWHEWSGDDYLTTLYYAEFDNRGPGSDTSNRVTWSGYHVIDATDAVNFTVSNFIQGEYWLPATGVPFDAGLL